VSFTSSNYSIAQSAGTVTITVNRTGGTAGAISVAYATASGTAVAGTDFTAASGTLNWADGDASSKSFVVAVSDATAFSGSRTFTATLSNSSGGATLSSPSSAGITISGSISGPVSGSGGPAAPTNFQMTSQDADRAGFSWTAAVGGAFPVASYNLYRSVGFQAPFSSTPYVTGITGTTYTDTAATNITTPGYGPQPYVPATIYNYAITAVDTHGNESPLQQQMIAWIYHDGVSYWSSQTNTYGAGFSTNMSDTAGQPASGPYDISLTMNLPGGNAYWLPYSGNPFLTNGVASWYMETGMFKYMTIDLKATYPGQTWQFDIYSRITAGDNENSGFVVLGGSDATFGPPSAVGQWVTYKVPLYPAPGVTTDGTSLEMGVGTWTGSISGSTLTVTSILSGMNVQGSAFLSGPGITGGPNGPSYPYPVGTENTSGGPGTYTISPAQGTTGTITINAQRTNLYKFDIIDLGTNTPRTTYINNWGLTVE
jgi:hypothetical protein